MKPMSRYASLLPTTSRELDEKPKNSPTCEIPGCRSLFVPGTNGYPDRHECGKTLLMVDDHRGDKRGICADHYLQHLVAIGKHPNQNLVDSDGRFDVTKVRNHWAALAQTEIEQTKKLARRSEASA